MDDSHRHSSSISICTDSYTEQEVLLLITVLNDKFNLNCNIMDRKPGQFRIYIKSKSLNNLRDIVTPYFIPSLLYKLHL
jgi:hypothetical protein